MRADSWSGLVTNASPYALPPGAAVEQWNLSCNVPGQLTSRGGMRAVRLSQAVADVVDCYPLESEGVASLLVLRANGTLEVHRSPAYGPVTAAASDPPLIASAPNVATSYTGRYTDTALSGSGTVWESAPGDFEASGSDFVVDGGAAATSHFPLYVDAMNACAAAIPLDGGNANYQGETLVTAANLCGNTQLPPGTAGSVPIAPLSLSATFGQESASLTWQAPSSDGGHAVLDYQVQISLDGDVWGQQPGAPVAAAATFGDGTASLSWSAPQDDGGLAIVGYQVIAEASINGGSTWTNVSL